MTREEQIEQAWFCKACLSSHCYDEKSFKEAAQWADKTMIKKACNWLKNIMYIQTDYEEDMDGVGCNFNFITCDFDSVDEFIECFKKAMEE